MVKKYLRFLIYGSLGLITALYLSGCEASIPKDTQVYEVNGAKVCDYQQRTPAFQDDCNNNNGSSGYYYNPGSSTIFYRSGTGDPVVVERNVPRYQTNTGGTVPLKAPVITNQSGSPLMNGDSVITSTSRSTSTTINTTPVRSTASFDAPGVGRVNAGKTTSASRGLSFGRSGSRGVGG
ncbi:phage tailspike protein [Leptolyngbya sp. FACHB-711]|uniref:phage tailspike protein n=1 Tax=unclassified Leptolyngbya TaxID=2650499 RepID=UPI001681F7DF|nr:phage tailspike protein [Leptolyngbya sp. FACHB-711]MBD1851463.1 hypothetical protein [Cyanobacteria bacterium FACHB-502]MBD2028285.1 hypothetical protein [Leptolyngbya sp. FACHB-711]